MLPLVGFVHDDKVESTHNEDSEYFAALSFLVLKTISKGCWQCLGEMLGLTCRPLASLGHLRSSITPVSPEAAARTYRSVVHYSFLYVNAAEGQLFFDYNMISS